ncbi:C40 family peptidase [Candidatus Wolfebacteria bacterium]|nr:C40 family peptidase [Candidatus Wolfebacteria bacterium]
MKKSNLFKIKTQIVVLCATIFFIVSFIFIPNNSLAADNLFNVDANTMALWRFNEATSSLVADETGINNGAAIGTTIVDGKFGKARYFNGISDYIVIPDHPSLDNLPQITLEAWVYPAGFDMGCWNQDEGLIVKGDNSDFYSSNAFALWIGRNTDTGCGGAYGFNQVKFGLEFGSAGGVSTSWRSPNQWYYVVGVYDGQNLKFYVNGVLENLASGSSSFVSNSKNLYINHHTWNGEGSSSQRMQGLIDEIRISNIARSAQEISDYYNQAISPPNQPPTISNPGQYKSDGQTQISESGITTEDIAIFKANIVDPDGDDAKLEIELRKTDELNGGFSNTVTASSSYVSSGATSTITVYGLSEGQYHWQVRAVDSQNNALQWQKFGTAGNADFEVKLPLSTKAANLAKLVIDGPYLGDGDTWGGKGWDSIQSVYVTQNEIFNGYNYWNNATSVKAIQFGAGLDCSGLILWSYNRSFDPNKYFPQNAIRYENASGQYLHNSETINENDLQAGDLLFMDKDNNGKADHVAMYVSNNENYNIVDAFSPGYGIISVTLSEFKIRPGFKNFIPNGTRRVILSPSLGGQVKAGSPVDLVVTDPEGFTITPTTAIQTDNEYLREIPGELYYAEGEIGSDGRPKDIVYWPKQKIGDYIVKVLPETSVSPTETYSLEFISGDQATILAENIPLSQIPSEGYGVVVEENGSINPFIPVPIDIKPGSLPNSINLGSKGMVPIAIFGSATFNVAQINLATITLANTPIKLKRDGQPMASYEDVNGDGFTDIVIHIITEALQLTSSDVKAELNGSLLDGSKIKGSDSVRIVP